jgi:hypothetical protein
MLPDEVPHGCNPPLPRIVLSRLVATRSKTMHTRMNASLMAMALALAAGSSFAADGPSFTQRFPKAAEAAPIVDKFPFLNQALADPEFWDKLANDPAFYDAIHKQLGAQAYRAFASVPSVRVRILHGSPVEYPAVIFEYQTNFDNISNWGSGPFKSGSCVFVGGGRDATATRTVWGGSEDPAVRQQWLSLLEQRQKLPSNRRTTFDPTINEFLKKVMPSAPLDQVQKEIEGKIQSLATAFKPYGAGPIEHRTMGQQGVKLTDKLYMYVRTFAPDSDLNNVATPFFWLIIAGGPHDPPRDYLPAFPGAEGFGSMTTGGRGGKSIYVTTLEPTGPGSLTEALNTPGPRTVQFKVSGQIVLPDETWITQPDMTLIGYTAPGEGVEICGRLCMGAGNIIMRGVRWRLRPPQSMDGMDTRGDLHNIIFDHCSFSYGSDEIIRFIGDGATFINGTIQNTILGPGTGGLGSHPYGPEVGGVVSFHHNILYNTFSRSPEVDCDLIDWRNNILYNVRSGHSRRPTSKLNYVHNMIIGNPSVEEKYSFRTGDNNYFEGDLFQDGHSEPKPFQPGVSAYLKAPYPVMPVTTYKATELEAKLLPTIGASLPVRDATDAHWIEGLKTRTGNPVYWKDRKSDNRSYNARSNDLANFEVLNLADFPPPVKAGAAAPADSDNDGMPDQWESAHKLNPNDASDAIADADKDGYTNLEEYLNQTDPQAFVDYKKPENNLDSVFAAKK